MNAFLSFRDSYGLCNEWPVSNSHIVAYIAYLSFLAAAPSTVSTYLSAIAYIHKINNWPDPTNSFIVKKMKEGFRRLEPHSDSRFPITFPILSRLVSILPSVCASMYEVVLFRTAFLLAFFAFLRVGEFTCSKKDLCHTRALCIGDFSFTQDTTTKLNVLLRFSKTDQLGNASILTIEKHSEANLCPVSAVRQFVSIRPPWQGLFFRHYGGEPLTSQQFTQKLKVCVGILGLPQNRFSAHSFRIGAATSAAMAGMSDEQIKNMGRWQSAAFKLYIRPNHVVSFI